jgi:HSP20 family molecular chaperone IbpA
MDVSNYDPDSLTIDIEGNVVVVEGKREKITDENNSLTNMFVWRFGLPAGAKPDDLVHELSDDGKLRFRVPLPKPKPFTTMSGKPKKEIKVIYKQ